MLPIEMEGKTYLTTQEALQHLGTSRATLYKLKDAGKLRSYHKGFSRTVYWSKEELDALREIRPDMPDTHD